MKKILFSDMDGTMIDLAKVKHVHDKEMLHELHKHGHLVAFNTGRNYQEALFSVNEHQFPYDYLVLNNGAHIVDNKGKEIFKKVIPGNIGKQIIEYCMSIEGIYVFFYDGKRTIGYHRNKSYEHTSSGIIENNEIDFIEELKKVKDFDILALHQEDEGVNELKRIQQYIRDHFGHYADGCLNLHYLDVTAAGCSKGSGINTLVEMLNEEIETYCIGDSYNDISMFEASDHAYTFNHVQADVAKHATKQVDYVYEVVEDMLK